MRVQNNHTARLSIGRATIEPGAEATIGADEAKMAGVQAWLKSGKLAEVKPPAKKTDDK